VGRPLDPPAASWLDPGIARPLRAVCGRALAPDPDARYPRVEELAADISSFLEGDRVEACPESAWERLVRLAVRHRVPILLVLAYVVARAALMWLAKV
jgi:hypothetical protein